jgi:hypothetical protein
MKNMALFDEAYNYQNASVRKLPSLIAAFLDSGR